MVEGNLSGMRRVLASLLLAILSFPLIAQILLANTASDLPSCCRRDGKHHCHMEDMGGSEHTPDGPALKATQPKCPLFPKTQVVPVYSKTMLITRALRVGTPHLVNLTIARADDHGPRIAFRDSVRKRGPPSSLDQTN
jgi:hypothetical protein